MTEPQDRADTYVCQYLDLRKEICAVMMADRGGRAYVREWADRVEASPILYTSVCAWAGRGDGTQANGLDTAAMLRSAKDGPALSALSPRFEWISGATKICPAVAPMLREAQRLRTIVVTKTRGWVYTYVRKNKRRDLHEDMFQEAMISLLRAVDMYDPAKGSWLTYVTPWIRQGIDREQDNSGATIRVPVHMMETTRKVRRVERAFETERGRKPTDDEVIALSKCLPIQVRGVRNLVRQGAELDRPLALTVARGSDPITLKDMVKSTDRAADPAVMLADKERSAGIARCLVYLNERERAVIVRRYGLDGRPEETVREISGRIGVSYQRVQQIERQALTKLWDKAPYGQEDEVA